MIFHLKAGFEVDSMIPRLVLREAFGGRFTENRGVLSKLVGDVV